MNSYMIGAVVRLTATFTDSTGAYVEPDSIKYTILQPDDTKVECEIPSNPCGSYPINQASTGVYYLDYPVMQEGTHYVYVQGLEGNIAASEMRFRGNRPKAL